MKSRFLSVCYKLGLLKKYRQISRVRYLRRLSKTKSDEDDFYYVENDKSQHLATDDLLVFNYYEGSRFALLCNPKDLIERDILTQGVFRKQISDYMYCYATSGSIVIDAGANVGVYSVSIAKSRPDVEFHAFEPHPIVSKRLARNVNLNRLQNVKCHQLGLSEKSAKLTFNAVAAGQENLGLSSVLPVASSVKTERLEIEVSPLDELFPVDGKPVSVIKIDVQGHELSVLLGGRALIGCHRPAIIFEHEDSNFGKQEDADLAKNGLAEFFNDLDYEVYYISLYDPSILFPVKWDRKLEGDLLALPR